MFSTQIMVSTSRTRSVKEGVNDQLLSQEKCLLGELKLEAIELILKYEEGTMIKG